MVTIREKMEPKEAKVSQSVLTSSRPATPPPARPGVLAWYERAGIATVSGLAIVGALRVESAEYPPLIFFTVLVLISAFLRTRYRDEQIGFEAVVAFPVLVLFSNPWMALLAVFTGLGIFSLYRSFHMRQSLRPRVFQASQAALSYFMAGWLLTALARDLKTPAARGAAYVMMVLGFLLAHFVLTAVRRYLRGIDYRSYIGHVISFYGKSLVLISPIVVVEVLLYPQYGALGFSVAFVLVLLVAYVMRSEGDAERRNVQLLRRNRELSILSKGSIDLFSAEGEELTVSRLVNLLSNIVPMKACAVVAWDPAPDVLGSVYRFADCRPPDQAILKWLEAAGFDHSAPRTPLVIPGGHERDFILTSSDSHQLIGGVQTREVIYGVVIYETDDRMLVEEDAVDLFNLVLTQAALSLQDQLLKREMHDKNIRLEKQAETMTTILEVSSGLIGVVDVAEVFGSISGAIRRTLDYRSVIFALRDPKTDEFVQSVTASGEDSWLRKDQNRVPASGIEEILVPEYRLSGSYYFPHAELRRRDLTLLFGSEASTMFDDQSIEVVVVPLMSESGSIGYFALARHGEGRPPSIDRIQTLEIFANQAVTALQSARQYQEIKRLTVIDALTPAYNHRYFQETLSRELHRQQRNQGQFSLAMLDIDNFKSINDTWGHQVGDQILKSLVQLLLDNVRDIDTVARYGGEEFAIIFPDLDNERVFAVADRIRRLVSERAFSVVEELTLHVTLSIGLATFPVDAATPSNLIARADAALYEAKNQGKDRVVASSAAGSAVMDRG